MGHLTPEWKSSEDYAIASRITGPETGQPVVLIAGLTNFGTQAAGEFFTNQSLLAEALQKAPIDWEHQNFEFVLHTKIIGNTLERRSWLPLAFGDCLVSRLILNLPAASDRRIASNHERLQGEMLV